MSDNAILDLLGALVGTAAGVIGILALVEDHRASTLWNRLNVGLLILLCFNVGLEGWSAAQDERGTNPVGVAFAFCLAVSWCYRVCGAVRRRRDAKSEGLRPANARSQH